MRCRRQRRRVLDGLRRFAATPQPPQAVPLCLERTPTLCHFVTPPCQGVPPKKGKAFFNAAKQQFMTEGRIMREAQITTAKAVKSSLRRRRISRAEGAYRTRKRISKIPQGSYIDELKEKRPKPRFGRYFLIQRIFIREEGIEQQINRVFIGYSAVAVKIYVLIYRVFIREEGIKQ